MITTSTKHIHLATINQISIHKVNWCHSNLWSHYNLHVVGQHGILCEVKWWRFVTLLQ